jgi:hypothetical protein
MAQLLVGGPKLRSLVRALVPKWYAALLIAACSSAAFAHHSYAMFDNQKVVQIEGTVKEFRFVNPHSWIVLEVKDASGNISESRIEANGPGYLVRFGWKRTSLNPGDSVVVSVNPLRDGAPGGNLLKVTFPDGHELAAKPEPSKVAGAESKQ